MFWGGRLPLSLGGARAYATVRDSTIVEWTYVQLDLEHDVLSCDTLEFRIALSSLAPSRVGSLLVGTFVFCFRLFLLTVVSIPSWQIWRSVCLRWLGCFCLVFKGQGVEPSCFPG